MLIASRLLTYPPFIIQKHCYGRLSDCLKLLSQVVLYKNNSKIIFQHTCQKSFKRFIFKFTLKQKS